MKSALSDRRAAAALALALLVPLAGCGWAGVPDSSSGGEAYSTGADAGGTGSVPGAPTGLTITTTSLPPATPGHAFGPVALDATGVKGTVTWSLAAGSLPAGISLDADGVLAGTPAVEGFYAFTVGAADAASADTQTLGLSVAAFGMVVTSGLVEGDAWAGRPVTLSTSGHVGGVTFTAVRNASGGRFAATDAAAGTATWVPGANAGSGVLDRVRAVDAGSGDLAEAALPVVPDPTAGHVAAFGASDVWYVETSAKTGTHAYATDLHEALARVGLRNPGSTNAAGTTADRLAELYVHVEILRQLNPLFLRGADGGAGVDGLPITFPFEEPGLGHSRPAAGSTLPGTSTRYSVMSLVWGSHAGLVGTAFLDGPANGAHENDTTTASAGELGVFVNRVVDIYNFVCFNDVLPNEPVTAADVASLKSLLYGLPDPGGRTELIREVAEGFARSVARVCAHEVGHSLSLAHTSPPVVGSLMNTSATFSPGATCSFLPADVDRLRAALPGVGRVGTPSSKPGSAMPEGGIAVCETCRLHAATGR
jgi:hypothetical protein